MLRPLDSFTDMKKGYTWVYFLFLLAAAGISVSMIQPKTIEADAILGTWVVPDGGGHIQIYKSGTRYYGKVAWLKRINHPDGTPKLDKNNPDPKLRTRPILGIVILKDFEYDGDNEWDDGTIYEPQSGTNFSGTLTLEDPNTLTVRGYVGFSIFGQSQTWTRLK
jgi:uncharacterized protein (DUF2147 family)